MAFRSVNLKLEALKWGGKGWDKEEPERGGRVVAKRSEKNFAIGLSKKGAGRGGGARRCWERTPEFRTPVFLLGLAGWAGPDRAVTPSKRSLLTYEEPSRTLEDLLA